MNAEKSTRYIGKCCREWVLSLMALGRGRCGLCGEKPTYLRAYDEEHD